MSGGSLNYIFGQVEDAANTILIHFTTQLQRNPSPQTQNEYATMVAFSALLRQVSKALKDAEWNMSGDSSDLSEVDVLIRPADKAAALTNQLRAMINQATIVLRECELTGATYR